MEKWRKWFLVYSSPVLLHAKIWKGNGANAGEYLEFVHID